MLCEERQTQRQRDTALVDLVRKVVSSGTAGAREAEKSFNSDKACRISLVN